MAAACELVAVIARVALARIQTRMQAIRNQAFESPSPPEIGNCGCQVNRYTAPAYASSRSLSTHGIDVIAAERGKSPVYRLEKNSHA